MPISNLSSMANSSMLMLDASHFKILTSGTTVYSCIIGNSSASCDSGTNIVATNSNIISWAQQIFGIGNQLYIAGAKTVSGVSNQAFIYSYNPN